MNPQFAILLDLFTPHISLTDCVYFFDRHITAGTAYAFTGTPLNANIPRSTSALQMSSITGIKAREILDSRGNPTVEVRNKTPSDTETP